MNDFLKFIAQKQVYGIVIIVALALILNALFDSFINKYIDRGKNEFQKKKKKTILRILNPFKKFIIVLIGIIYILDLFGINVSAIVASLGIASAVIGLALQDTLKDILSGITIILDNYFVVGDYVKYKDFTGIIIELGLRTTKIQEHTGQVYVIANRNITEVINLSQKTAAPNIIVPTAYEEKTSKVEKVLKEIVEEMKTWPTMDAEKTCYLGIIDFDSSSINYGIKFYCSPGKQWEYKREALKLIKERYEKNGIKIPYSQIEVHNAK